MGNTGYKNVVDEEWRIPDSLWDRIEPLLPQQRSHPKGGRPYIPARQCMDGIFYVLRTGCQWKALPKGFAAASTVHLRFQQWQAAGVFERLWREGLVEYDTHIGLDWAWQAMDGAMTKAPLGGKGNGTQYHRPRQEGNQTKSADRRPRDSYRAGRGWSESA